MSSDVHLRSYASGDLELLRGLLADDEAMRYLGGALSEDDITGRHERYKHPAAGEHLFVIEYLGESAGWIGLWDGEDEGACEAGWHVLSPLQGRGIASAALAALLELAGHLGYCRYVYAHPSVDNVASNALCRSAGFERLGEVVVEFPKGRPMRTMRWRYDLRPAGRTDAHSPGTRV